MIGVDLHDADITADLSSPTGRKRLVDEVRAATGGRVDGVIACAGISSGDAVTVSINYFGAVATLEGLRPFLAEADQPRAATISSIALLQSIDDDIVDACLRDDEPAALAAAEGKGVFVYPSTKRALARWVRRTAPTEPWAGAGIPLNAVAPGVVHDADDRAAPRRSHVARDRRRIRSHAARRLRPARGDRRAARLT